MFEEATCWFYSDAFTYISTLYCLIQETSRAIRTDPWRLEPPGSDCLLPKTVVWRGWSHFQLPACPLAETIGVSGGCVRRVAISRCVHFLWTTSGALTARREETRRGFPGSGVSSRAACRTQTPPSSGHTWPSTPVTARGNAPDSSLWGNAEASCPVM